MGKDLRKRLEEAAIEYRCVFLNRLNVVRKLRGKEPLSASDEVVDMCLDTADISFKDGAEYGYKEAIEVAKEWLKEHAKWYYHFNEKDLLSNFEKYMLKLWEDEK